MAMHGRSPSGSDTSLRTAERLDRVVDEIDDDAAHLLEIHADLRQPLAIAALDLNVAEEVVVEGQRLVERGIQVGGRRARRRHARELRELVDERLERLDLADDRRRALFDQRPRRRRRRTELPAHALGAQLDRRQRILDLVREPPGDVAPRRHALRPDERRHVVEHEDGAARAAIVAQELRRGRGEVYLAPVAQQRHFLHRRHRTAATRLCQERLERAKILALPELLGADADDRPVHFQQAKRRAVDRLDMAGTDESMAPRLTAIRRAMQKGGAVALGTSVGSAWRRNRYHGPYQRELRAARPRSDGGDARDLAHLVRATGELYRAVGDAIRGALEDQGTPGFVFCHLSHAYADGASLYFTFISRAERGRAPRPVASGQDRGLRGDRRDGEHDHPPSRVGRDHAPYMEAEAGELGLDALRALKDRLDPAGIMNPGKLLPARGYSPSGCRGRPGATGRPRRPGTALPLNAG